jgi:ribosomal protein S18 acetylase RimI-like enzyme
MNEWETAGSLAVLCSRLHDVIELRVLPAQDWTIWRGLRLAALAQAPYAFGARLADWQGEGDREQRWRARLTVPGSYNVVALLAGEPVGMASGMPTAEDGVVELISMWVRPAVRGRGVGDLLVRAVERWARDRGAQVVRLAVAQGNEAAYALYQRNGFRRTGDVGDLMPDGVRREDVMAKMLSLRPIDGATPLCDPMPSPGPRGRSAGDHVQSDPPDPA